MFVHIVNKQIYLKLVALNDARRIFELTDQSREHLREWLPWLDHIQKVEDTKKFIQHSRDQYAKHQSMNMVVIFQDDIVGVAGFNEIDWTNQMASIGYWIGKDYVGKGIITKVVESLTKYAYDELNLNRVEIRAAEGNKKSRAIPERLGFKKEGCLREAEWLYDHFVDHVIYGMLTKDWKKRV